MVKKTWLLCLLFLFGISTLPVQSQAPTSTPNIPAQVTDPATLHRCGLPATSAQFTSAASFFTFNMTADCTYSRWSARDGNAIVYISSGTFTINGNGHTITGPPHNFVIALTGSNSVLNLNNVTIRGAGGARAALYIDSSALLNARNVIFRDNYARHALSVTNTNSRAVLENVQFLNNRQFASGATPNFSGSAIDAQLGAQVTLTNGIFRGNRNYGSQATDVIASRGTNATLIQLMGCITFENNVRADGATAANNYGTQSGTGRVTDSTTGPCPAQFSYWLRLTPQKKPKKTATPRPSATARPLATTCIDLNQATDIAVHATHGLGSGVQCQRLGGGGIGLQSIVEAGFIDAVDVWGYVEQGVEVCFPQAGELLFLDASMMPRAAAPLASTVVNGMTCGAIETPGSIVLMPAG